MKLIHARIRPGRVLEVISDGAGTIKASAPGLFTDADGTEVLPPVYPWPFGHHPNSYSCPKTGEEIWIISFTDNPLQLHWVRKDDIAENLKDLPLSDEAQNLEVVVNREFEDSQWAILYFSNDDGWMMRKGEDGLINIRADGSILLKTNFNKRIIDICKDSIALGSEGEADDHAMLYEEWRDKWAKEIINQLKTTLMSAASANPYTVNLAPAFQMMASALEAKAITTDPIKSKHVSIASN